MFYVGGRWAEVVPQLHEPMRMTRALEMSNLEILNRDCPYWDVEALVAVVVWSSVSRRATLNTIYVRGECTDRKAKTNSRKVEHMSDDKINTLPLSPKSIEEIFRLPHEKISSCLTWYNPGSEWRPKSYNFISCCCSGRYSEIWCLHDHVQSRISSWSRKPTHTYLVNPMCLLCVTELSCHNSLNGNPSAAHAYSLVS